MKSFLNGKKGLAVLDVIIVVIIILVLALISVLSEYVFNQLNDSIQGEDDISDSVKEQLNSQYEGHASLLDNLIMLAFVLLVIFNIVSVFMLDTHPIFFILTLIILIFIFIAVLLIGNAYDDFMSSPDIAPSANNLPWVSFMFRNLLGIVIGYSMIMGIVLFIKVKLR